MPEAQEEDEIEQVPIPLKNVAPTIPKKEWELKELIFRWVAGDCLPNPGISERNPLYGNSCSRGETNGFGRLDKTRINGHRRCGLRSTDVHQGRARDGRIVMIVIM